MDLNTKVGNVKLSVLLVAVVTSFLCAILMSIIEIIVILPGIYRFVVWMCMWIPISMVLSKLYNIYERTKSSN